MDNESSVVSVAVLREKALEEKKLILISIRKNKECTVASFLLTLVNSSKDFIDKSNYSEL